MRNKHLEVRRRIQDAKLQITDAELFGSPLYASVLSDLAETATHRFRRKCKVQVFWNESSDFVAATNSRIIRINSANPLTSSFPTRKLKDLSLRGLLGHEIGHIIYTDFEMDSIYRAKLTAGEFYPKAPDDLDDTESGYLEELQDLLSAKDPSTLRTVMEASSAIDNILEDVYIEERMCDKFPGTFAIGIRLNDVRFAEKMPSVEQQIKDNHYGFSVIVNLMIQYCKTGDINNLTKTRSEFLDALYDCLPIIDAAIYDSDGKVRFDATNRLVIRLWPYLKEIREEVKKHMDNGESDNLQEKLSQQISGMGGTPVGNGRPVRGTESFSPDKDAEDAQRNIAQTVLETEAGRISLEETDSISAGSGGVLEHDDDYAGSGYENSAADIERVLSKLAESRVCAEQETELCSELQAFADGINYGDAHKDVPVTIHRINQVPDELVSRYESVCKPLLKLSRRLQQQVLPVLKEQRRGGRETGLRMGHRMLVRSLYHDDGRIFYKNRLPRDEAALAVALLIDESGSMCACDRITKARAAAIVLYDFCKSLGIPVLVQGHDSWGVDAQIYSYAEFEAKDAGDCYRMMDMSARCGNRDGAALRYVAERLVRRPEEVKLLIIISDGQPASSGYGGTEAEADLRGIKREFSNRGITIYAAAIGEDKQNIERIYGDGFLDISNLDDLPTNLTRLVSMRMKRK